MKKLNALTTLEAILITLLAFLAYFYTKQLGSDALVKETYKTTARSAYTALNKTMPEKTGLGTFEGKFNNEKDIVDYIGKTIKALKYCNAAQDEFCWSHTWLWGAKEKPGAHLKSMQYVVVDFVSKNCSYNKNIPHTCAFVYMDSNGANSPNEVGKDILLFYMTKYGFVPAGTEHDVITKASDCNLAKEQYDWGCTAKLLGLN